MSATAGRAMFRLRANCAAIIAEMRTIWWRMIGMQIGAGTLLPKVHVTWPHQVSLGKNCRLEHDIYFKFDGIYAPGPSIMIGDRVFVGFGCEFNVRQRVEIGADCLIGSGCKFIDHDHGSARRDLPMNQQLDGAEGAIVLESDVWLGANVVVLKNVRIGAGAIVAAGAVARENIPAYEIWGGVPARKIGLRT
ncbi:MAG: acyltransferase [Verrucomicrobiota bacterium]|nr:acyltransferase [Verrucomicrobiota bacterium]